MFTNMAIWTFSVIVLVCSNFFDFITCEKEQLPKEIECMDKCGGIFKHIELRDKGELLCTFVEDGGERYSYPNLPCYLECMGEKPEEDQTKCFADYCRTNGEIEINHFCREPKSGGLKTMGECDLVEKGEAKYYGDSCYSNFQ